MPTEREKIEAELAMNERERTLAEIERVLAEIEELEAHEGELPLSGEKIKLLLDALHTLAQTHDVNSLPEPVKQMLAKTADAEYSALDQLAALRESRRKTKPTT
jgi:hypothetical protein